MSRYVDDAVLWRNSWREVVRERTGVTLVCYLYVCFVTLKYAKSQKSC